MNFIFNINRTFNDHFYKLLNNTKKDDYYNAISEEELNEMESEEDSLDLLWLTIEDAIHEYLHYNLDIYLEVQKDDVWNTIPYIAWLWKMYNWYFSWIVLKSLPSWYFQSDYIVDNTLLVWDDQEQENKLKSVIWDIHFNNIIALISDLFLFDDYLWTYIAMSSEFEEAFSNKLIYINYNNKLIYINSTMNELDIMY